MKLRGCGSSHYILAIKDGTVQKVHNVDSCGRPGLVYKKLEDIYRSEAERTHKFQDGCDHTVGGDSSSSGNKYTPMPYADRKTSTRSGDVVEEDEPECPSNEKSHAELTLSQLRKKCKRKKRKASESILLTPKEEDDDLDLSEPLCKFRVKVSKSPRSKMVPADRSSPTSSRSTQLLSSEPSRGALATVIVKVEDPEEEYFEHRETTHMADGPSIRDGSVNFISSASGFLSVDRSSPTSSSSTQLASSESSTGTGDALSFSKDLATADDKVESPEMEYFECREMIHMNDDPLICDGSVDFIASESGFVLVNHESKSTKSKLFTNDGEICGFNEASHDNLGDITDFFLASPMNGENMEVDNEEDMANNVMHSPVSEVDKEECVKQQSSIVSSSEDVEDLAASTSDCSQSHPCLQQTPEEINISGVQDSNSTIDGDHHCVDLGQGSDSHMVEECAEGPPANQEAHISAVQDSISTIDGDQECVNFGQASDSDIVEVCTEGSPTNQEYVSPSPDDDNQFVSVEAKSPIPVKDQDITSVNADADSNSLNPEDTLILHEQPSFVPEDTSILSEQLPTPPSNAGSEVKFSNHNYQTDITTEASEIRNSGCIELRHAERLPSTRKTISPTSQEKLCLAMKSPELLDDMDHYKCKEKLYFGEQAENNFPSTNSDVEDTQPNKHPQQPTRLGQNKDVSPKHMLKKLKNFKKGSPPKRCLPPKGCLDGPRLGRTMPRLTSGCTSIRKCSESAIAFSQRQMHDIESLASKLMAELNSMKVIVEEKLLYEAYRSTSLKNEADEVKSAIKSATKTEETAKKWLSIMTRDSNRFCKIMKLKEDGDASDPASVSIVEEKPVQRERKKISFADEVGGTLCDVKVFEVDRASLELKESSTPKTLTQQVLDS